jgi:Holliday junction resolvase RusA-like endonuclease
MAKKIRFDLTPVSAVRTNQGDKIFFRIPMSELRKDGLKRRKRIERYNDYKVSLNALAKAARFNAAEQGMHVTFFMPIPDSWAKYKKKDKHMQLHFQRPDVDNLLKGFLDGLLVEDNFIADIRATKRWVNQTKGYIEVVFNPPDQPSSDTLA